MSRPWLEVIGTEGKKPVVEVFVVVELCSLCFCW